MTSMDWIEMIGTLGFPIVAAMALACFMYKVWLNEQTQNNKREEQMMSLVRELSSKLADLGRIVDENTKVLATLKEDIDHLKESIKDNENEK